MTWMINPPAAEWDQYLASLNGHPLQSALWGDSRRIVDGHEDLRFVYLQNGLPVWMARAEIRKVLGFGKVAWIPRGPTKLAGFDASCIGDEFKSLLRKRGVLLYITDEYTSSVNENTSVRTIWLDLEQGMPALEKKMDKQWRYGVRKAFKQGVEIQQIASTEDVKRFFAMCMDISQSKGFVLPGSQQLMECLLKNSNGMNVDMRLFLAKHEGRIGAGAFVARSGKHVHYLWGASDRELSRLRVGEAVQWAVIEWAATEGCIRYDLEGIDPINNPGVYAFKKKMGGDEIALRGLSSYPLGICGRGIEMIGKMTGRF